ncbi:hypothetical protein [Paenibacillus naphthalenovorans]|uniref:hypothetical protein n=1 Tax=Paenibacillus naphthalenovorans TaxID=162209 RepID=UPI003D2CDA61
MNIIIQVLVFSILIALTAVTYLTVLSIRQKLSCTTGMMAAMLIGSMTGLITGTVLGADQSFSINCMLAMIVGVGGGVMLGMPFHAMAVLDGLMAGVMSGMMGAMLGSMLSPDFLLPMSFFLTLLFVIAVLLLHRIMKQEAGILQETEPNREKMKTGSILTVCVTIALFSLVIMGSSYKDQPKAPEEPHVHTGHHKMSE